MHSRTQQNVYEFMSGSKHRGASAGTRSRYHPLAEKLRLYMKNHALWCLFVRKWIAIIAFLNTLTIGTAFPLEMTSGARCSCYNRSPGGVHIIFYVFCGVLMIILIQFI